MGLILIACEESQTVCKAFREKGHEAYSCDILPCSGGHPEWHYQQDVTTLLDFNWDLVIAHPPCTYLCSSGLHWNKRVPGREAKTEAALEFVREIFCSPTNRLALENPIGRISTAIRKADQIIQPWQFGHDASKATALWLKNLPLLRPTRIIEGRLVNGKPRWANQTDSGQNRLGPSPIRGKERSKTYKGIAEAMANQWGSIL